MAKEGLENQQISLRAINGKYYLDGLVWQITGDLPNFLNSPHQTFSLHGTSYNLLDINIIVTYQW